MSLVFKELGDEFLKVFMDNLNVHSENWEDHLRHLEAVLSKLREVNLKLNQANVVLLPGVSLSWVMWLVTKGLSQTLARLMPWSIFQYQRQSQT
jgi:hypothetical protein